MQAEFSLFNSQEKLVLYVFWFALEAFHMRLDRVGYHAVLPSSGSY
jgi:hypothetical protein